MKISYNWLKNYLNVNLPTEKLADLLTDIGLEVEGIEERERQEAMIKRKTRKESGGKLEK